MYRSSQEHHVISPELVLVDPELAEVARRLLPDAAGAWSRPAAEHAAPAPAHALPPADRPRPARRPRRVRSPAVLIAVVLVFAGIAAAVAYLAERLEEDVGFRADRSSLRRNQVGTATRRSDTQPARATTTVGAKGAPVTRTRDWSGRGSKKGAARRETRASPVPKKRTARRETRASPVPTRRRRAATDQRAKRSAPAVSRPTSNVLGVVVAIRGRSGTLRWSPPPGSRNVLVLRRRGKAPAKAVYRGTRTWFTDRGLRPGVYTYTIINYDRTGNASSGVPTVVSIR